jgi:hypothetical protein
MIKKDFNDYTFTEIEQIILNDLNKKDRVLLWFMYNNVKRYNGVKYLTGYNRITETTYNLRDNLLREYCKYCFFYYNNKDHIKEEAYKLLVTNPNKKMHHCKGAYYKLFNLINNHPLKSSFWFANKLKKSHYTVKGESVEIFKKLYGEGDDILKEYVRLLTTILFGVLHKTRIYGR